VVFLSLGVRGKEPKQKGPATNGLAPWGGKKQKNERKRKRGEKKVRKNGHKGATVEGLAGPEAVTDKEKTREELAEGEEPKPGKDRKKTGGNPRRP